MISDSTYEKLITKFNKDFFSKEKYVLMGYIIKSLFRDWVSYLENNLLNKFDWEIKKTYFRDLETFNNYHKTYGKRAEYFKLNVRDNRLLLSNKYRFKLFKLFNKVYYWDLNDIRYDKQLLDGTIPEYKKNNYVINKCINSYNHFKEEKEFFEKKELKFNNRLDKFLEGELNWEMFQHEIRMED